jgi:predicted RNA-binding Zn-ribbon protein involved in translation (DUF1610 family)
MFPAGQSAGRMTLKPCPKCGNEWFRVEVIKAVVVADEPRPDRNSKYREMGSTVQYSYICNTCGFELP